MSRMWGAALDHVVEVDVVLANSSIVTASATKYPDIFWALKGAGASFGVITQFKVITHAPPSETVQYSYTFSQKPFTNLAGRFKLWQKMVSDPALNRKLASQLVLSEAGMILEGTYFGPQHEFDALNLTSVFPDATSSNILVFNDWLGQVAHWGEDVALTLGGGISSAFYSKSLAFTAKDIMPDATVDAWFKYLDDVNKGTLVWFAIFDLEGGATNDVPKDATAYGHRDALFYLQTYAVDLLKVTDTTRKFVQGMNDVITQNMKGHNLGAYAGYVDPALLNAQQQYWNTNYPRLQKVKKAIDPADIFHNPQSVRLP
jgi:FAD/FMN-containing dehydrogenase